MESIIYMKRSIFAESTKRKGMLIATQFADIFLCSYFIFSKIERKVIS